MGSPVDVEGLFKKFTVLEVNEIERKLKSDVERKKEDLRQMVGRRYRDIIEAADSIRSMKDDADTILETVRSVQQSVDSLQQIQQRLVASQARAIRSSASRNTLSAPTITSLYYRLYEDLCELIWDCLDEDQLLEAAWIHTFGGWLYDQLTLRDLSAAQKLVVADRKEKLGQFSGRIVEKSLTILRSSSVKSEVNFEHAICALIVLKQMTLETALLQLLEERLKSVSACFQAPDQSSRQQMVNSVLAIMSTLAQVKALFYPDLASGNKTLIFEQIDEIITQKYRSGRIAKFLHRHGGHSYDQLFLDPHNRSGNPLIISAGKLNDIPADSCVELCSGFIRKVEVVMKSQVKAGLAYVETVEGLTNLKLDILKRMQETFHPTEWQTTCETVLGRPLDIWEDLLAEMLDIRLKEISRQVVQSHFDDLMNNIQSSVAVSDVETAETVETNESRKTSLGLGFGEFLWSPLAGEKDFTRATTASDLKLRSSGYIPAVHELIAKLDSSLAGLRVNMVNYTNAILPSKPGDALSLHLTKSMPVERGAGRDPGGLWEDLKQSMDHSVARFCSNMSSLISELKEQSSRTDDFDIKRIVFCGKIVLCLADLSPELQKSFTLPSSHSIGGKAASSSLIGQRSSRESSDEPMNAGQRGSSGSGTVNHWQQVVKVSLVDTAANAFSLWIDLVTPRMNNILKDHSDMNAWFDSIQEWECMEIQGEGSDGSKSKFYLPTQCSYPVHRFLIAQCHELDAVGLHSVHKNIHEKFISAARQALLDYYSATLDRLDQEVDDSGGGGQVVGFSQKRALHVVFELQVIQMLLGTHKTPKSPIGQQNHSSILSKFESLADPFDLDMLYAHNKKNIKRFVQKSTQLYGALMLADVSSSLLRSALPKPTSGSGAQEQPQIVPLRTGVKRFQTLAIPANLAPKISTSDHQSRHGDVGKLLTSGLKAKSRDGYAGQSAMAAETLRGGASASNASLTASLLQKSSSFYDKISTGWFGM